MSAIGARIVIRQSSRRCCNNPPRRVLAIAALLVLLPTLMGGCPTFRNEVVDIANTATTSIILSEDETSETLETAFNQALVATINLFFDQLRSDEAR